MWKRGRIGYTVLLLALGACEPSVQQYEQAKGQSALADLHLLNVKRRNDSLANVYANGAPDRQSPDFAHLMALQDTLAAAELDANKAHKQLERYRD